MTGEKSLWGRRFVSEAVSPSQPQGFSCYNRKKEERLVRRIADLTEEELELLVERKILEILGDPDEGLELREEVKAKLKSRLRDTATVPHEEAVKHFHAD
jgi:uncharacterized protein (DUF2164 family)